MKYKFGKWFSSFKYNGKSYKECWRLALHDPAYLIMAVLSITIVMYVFTL